MKCKGNSFVLFKLNYQIVNEPIIFKLYKLSENIQLNRSLIITYYY